MAKCFPIANTAFFCSLQMAYFCLADAFGTHFFDCMQVDFLCMKTQLITQSYSGVGQVKQNSTFSWPQSFIIIIIIHHHHHSSSFIIHHSSFIIIHHHSSFIIHHSSSFIIIHHFLDHNHSSPLSFHCKLYYPECLRPTRGKPSFEAPLGGVVTGVKLHYHFVSSRHQRPSW